MSTLQEAIALCPFLADIERADLEDTCRMLRRFAPSLTSEPRVLASVLHGIFHYDKTGLVSFASIRELVDTELKFREFGLDDVVYDDALYDAFLAGVEAGPSLHAGTTLERRAAFMKWRGRAYSKAGE